jgi:hypothetical protein
MNNVCFKEREVLEREVFLVMMMLTIVLLGVKTTRRLSIYEAVGLNLGLLLQSYKDMKGKLMDIFRNLFQKYLLKIPKI